MGGGGAAYLLERKYHLTFKYYLIFFETGSCIPHFSISMSHHISLLAAVLQEQHWPRGCKEGSSALAVTELALGLQAGARQHQGAMGGVRERKGPGALTGAAGGSGAGWRGGVRPEGATWTVSSLCAHTASPLPVSKQRAGRGALGRTDVSTFPLRERPTWAGCPFLSAHELAHLVSPPICVLHTHLLSACCVQPFPGLRDAYGLGTQSSFYSVRISRVGNYHLR